MSLEQNQMVNFTHMFHQTDHSPDRPNTSKRAAVFIVLCAILAFTILPVYQSLRQPRIGDADNLHLGLLVLNRYALQSFPRDTAMHAGVWWPGYTPWYLAALGLGSQITGDIGILFAIITAVDYIILLTGFYCLGVYLGLPLSLSLLLAYMSGLYQVTGHGLAWAGVGNEMATPRNAYLAFFPWILLASLWLYRKTPQKTASWFLFGLVLGLSTVFHSVTGGVVVGVFALMLLVGALFGQFNWRALMAFLIGTVPGIFFGYKSVSSILDVTDSVATTAASQFVYFSVARANVFFYRIPNWSIPIVAFTLLLLLTGVLLWQQYKRKGTLDITLWIIFGLLQFGSLLLILLVDWWTLLAAIEWVRRVRSGMESRYERLFIVFLAAVNFLTLSVSATASMLGISFDFFPLAAVARTLQRGQSLGYAGLIVLSCFILWDQFQKYPAQKLYFIAVIAAAITGLHVAEFETIPGQWLPFDYWIYGGVVLLVLWPQLNRYNLGSLRNVGVSILVVQAVTRLLGFPAPPIVTFLIGFIIFAASFVYNKQSSLSSPAVMGAASLAILLVVLLPIGGGAFLPTSFVATRKVILRDWSRLNRQSAYSQPYIIGTWLRENTPPDSLILTNRTELRYWSFRSQTIGLTDAQFLQNDPILYATFQQEALRVESAFDSLEELLAYAQEVHANYIVIDKQTTNFTLDSAAGSLVFENGGFSVFQLKPSSQS